MTIHHPFRIFVIAVVAAILIAGIWKWNNKTVEPSFYYWESTYRISPNEQSTLKNLNINKLYIKLFDIKWDETSKSAIPVAKIKFNTQVDKNLNVIPVVYITNQVFQNIKPQQIAHLAQNCNKLINSITTNNNLNFNEIQFDCDWSDSSREAYFDFLKKIRANNNNQNISLSATIRLHQVKYNQRTGVPPVDKGLLMYYNMGNLRLRQKSNSIYDFDNAQRYIAHLNDYPLALDVALPHFSWGIQQRNGHIAALLNNFYKADFKDTARFRSIDSAHFCAKQSFFYKGFYFKNNDTIKVETITPQVALQAATQLSEHLKHSSRTVVFYRLDSLILTSYETEHFKKIIDCFN
jgi:hypothetical protein